MSPKTRTLYTLRERQWRDYQTKAQTFAGNRTEENRRQMSVAYMEMHKTSDALVRAIHSGG